MTRCKWICLSLAITFCVTFASVSAHPFGLETPSAPEEAPFEGRMQDDFGDFNFDSGRASDDESASLTGGTSGSADPSTMFDGHDDSFESARGGGSSGGPSDRHASPVESGAAGGSAPEADLGGSELGESDDAPDHHHSPGRSARREPSQSQDDGTEESGPPGQTGPNQSGRSFDFEMDGSFDREEAPSKGGRSRSRNAAAEQGERPSSASDSVPQSGRFALEEEEEDRHASSKPHREPSGERSSSGRSARPHSSSKSSGPDSAPLSVSPSFGTSSFGQHRSRARSGRTPPPRSYQRPPRGSERNSRPSSPSASSASTSDQSNESMSPDHPPLSAYSEEDTSIPYSSVTRAPLSASSSSYRTRSNSPPSSPSHHSYHPSSSLFSSSPSVDDTELRLLQDFERTIGDSSLGNQAIGSASRFNTPDGLSPGAGPFVQSYASSDDSSTAGRALSEQEVPISFKYETEMAGRSLPTINENSGSFVAPSNDASYDGSQLPVVPISLHGQSLVNPLLSSSSSSSSPSVDSISAVVPGKSSSTDAHN